MPIDKYGQPFKPRDTLQEPQSNQTAYLATETNYHPFRRITPEKLINILEQSETGNLTEQAYLFSDMEKTDLHLLAEISKRKRRMLGLKWGVRIKKGPEATPKEKANCKVLEGMIAEIEDFSNSVLFNMGDAIGKGYSMLEIATDEGDTGWEFVDGTWLIKHVQYRHQSWFVSPYNKRNAIHLRDNTAYGQTLRPLGWIRHAHRATSGYIGESALYHTVARVTLLKQMSLSDFSEFNDVFGFPSRLGKYPANATKEEISTLRNAVISMGRRAAGVIPEGMAIDYLAAVSGQPDPFLAMIEWAEKSESIAVNGGTLTSSADGKTSTNALGLVHQDEAWDITVGDTGPYAQTLTRDVIYILATLNLGLDKHSASRYEFYFEIEDEKSLKDIGDAASQYGLGMQKLVQMGLKVPTSHIYRIFEIPRPAEGEDVLLPPPPLGGGGASAAATAALKAAEPPELKDWQRQLTPMIDPLKNAIEAAETPEDLINQFVALAAKMDVDTLHEGLTRAGFEGFADGLSDER